MSNNVVPFEKPKRCPMCEGSGKYRIIGPDSPHGLLITCDHCGGAGHLTQKKEEENAKALEKFLKE